jgi:hypothetical protein
MAAPVPTGGVKRGFYRRTNSGLPPPESIEYDGEMYRDIWDDIAFPTVKQTLEWFFADRAAGVFNSGNEFSVRSRDILPTEKI